ncbi:DNA-directed RNA polymerase subunit omega [bacterium]|nr:DNA-directed RNA polymerase subunit omega [bacterium]
MVSTLSLDEVEKYKFNIYELVVAVAKRARQINQERRAKIEMDFGSEEDFTDETAEETEIKIEGYGYERRIKPTRQAIEELLSGQLIVKYPDKDDDSQK